MNDIEKAKEYFYNQMEIGKIESDYQQEIFETAISALEKQIAKKSKKIKLRQGTQWLCPACGSTVAGLGVDLLYCNECGQRIDDDWSVEE